MDTSPTTDLVFTDLDGTLLDDGYDLEAAAQAINALHKEGVAVVPVSSKTLPELATLAAYIDVPTPWVFENGAGIAWPEDLAPAGTFTHQHGRAIELEGPGYAAICDTLTKLRRREGYDFAGFADMSVLEVANATGLTTQGAQEAKQRLASEPIQWHDSTEMLEEFTAALAQHELLIVAGGRFLHVMPLANKGKAAKRVRNVYRYIHGRPRRTVACGDSPNDLPLFKVADVCVVCPGRDGDYLPVPEVPAVQAKAAGPVGWDAAVHSALRHCATT